MLASLALFSSVTSRNAIAEGVGLASEAVAESLSSAMDKIIYLRGHEIVTAMNGFEVVEWISESNAEFDAMEDPQEYIDQMDENWTSTPLDVVPEFMETILENNISLMLKAQFLEHYTYEHGVQVFAEILVTNKYGALTAATDRTTDFRQDDESWWHSVQEAELRISDVLYDESSASYGVCACTSVRNSAGESIGVAKAVINILSVAKDIELTNLGYDTSELKVVAPDGTMIFSSRAYVILQNVSSSPFFEDAVGERGHFSVREGNEDRLFSFATSTGYLEYEGHGWLVFLSYAEDEILGPATELRNRILTVAALALALGATVSVALSRSITGPITALEKAAQGMAKGDLNQKIAVSRKDELGELSEAFNDMAAELTSLYSGLDGLVKIRTKELEAANDKLNVLGSITRHDALNQIVVQKGWLGMAMKASKDPVISDYLRKVETSTDNLVEFLKFTSDYEDVGINKPEWINVNEAFSSATVGLDLANIDIGSNLEGVEVLADPMFPKVLHNLIANSLKHGQKVTRISLSYSDGSDGLTITIEDDGIGIPEDQKDHIFEKEHASGRLSHGLFLTAAILKMTRISIRESGTPGEGARFEMLVPKGSYRQTSDPSPSS
jgi:signal transduction histidine kinase